MGVVDESAGIPDDEAADRAIRQVVEAGRFFPRRDSRFETEHYWDTIKEMTSFIESRRHKLNVRPSYSHVEEIYEDLGARTKGKARLRCRWRSLIAVYGRAG